MLVWVCVVYVGVCSECVPVAKFFAKFLAQFLKRFNTVCGCKRDGHRVTPTVKCIRVCESVYVCVYAGPTKIWQLVLCSGPRNHHKPPRRRRGKVRKVMNYPEKVHTHTWECVYLVGVAITYTNTPHIVVISGTLTSSTTWSFFLPHLYSFYCLTEPCSHSIPLLLIPIRPIDYCFPLACHFPRKTHLA